MTLLMGGTGTSPMSSRLDIAPDHDSRLIERIGALDHDAFEQLYRRFARPILSMAIRQLRDRGRAEDATQDVFVSVWRSAKTYRSDRGTAAGWIFAVARNAIIKHARQPLEKIGDPPEVVAVWMGPEERAEQAWLAWRVHTALELVPERERKVLELAYWSGLSQSEIARQLAIPVGTVKTRTRSGLAHLAELLRDIDQ